MHALFLYVVVQADVAAEPGEKLTESSVRLWLCSMLFFTRGSGILCNPVATTSNLLFLFQLNIVTVEHLYEIFKFHRQSQAPAKPGMSKLSGIQSLLCYKINTPGRAVIGVTRQSVPFRLLSDTTAIFFFNGHMCFNVSISRAACHFYPFIVMFYLLEHPASYKQEI